ncbi:MAG: YHS domain-containing protein [Acidobacteriia bacterium]|nr:YHS domain-containing protein [Terriglobia bacterium]
MEETYGLEDFSDGSVIRSVDPVCGKMVVEREAAGKTEYAGEVYYFCSKECQRNFEQEPAVYMAQPH